MLPCLPQHVLGRGPRTGDPISGAHSKFTMIFFPGCVVRHPGRTIFEFASASADLFAEASAKADRRSRVFRFLCSLLLSLLSLLLWHSGYILPTTSRGFLCPKSPTEYRLSAVALCEGGSIEHPASAFSLGAWVLCFLSPLYAVRSTLTAILPARPFAQAEAKRKS